MDFKLTKLFALDLMVTISLISCEKIDVQDMFVSEVTANQRFEQSMIWNDSHPARKIVLDSDEYCILTLADCHIGGTDDLDKVIDTAKKLKAAAVVMAGDLTSGNAKDYSLFQKHLPAVDSLRSFIITGNHDLWFDGWSEFYSRLGSSTYIFTIKTPAANDLFICLDSGSATLGDKQLNWLRENLQILRPAYRHCIIFTHENIIRNRHTLSTNPLVEEVTALLELFTRYNVNMVIAGHDHQQYSAVFGNTTYIVMDALIDGLENSGYFQIDLNNGSLGYSFKKL
jgi:3',5'-cyclic AMP phosphodiesterase CpdA